MKDVIQIIMTNTIIVFSELLYIFLKTIPFSLILQSFSDICDMQLYISRRTKFDCVKVPENM